MDELGFNLVPVNSMTPETENSTHVFWAHNRNFQLNSDNMNNLIKNQMTTAWLEDLIIMEQQQIRIEKNKKKFIPIKIDKAPERARKIIYNLINSENECKKEYSVISKKIDEGNKYGVS